MPFAFFYYFFSSSSFIYFLSFSFVALILHSSFTLYFITSLWILYLFILTFLVSLFLPLKKFKVVLPSIISFTCIIFRIIAVVEGGNILRKMLAETFATGWHYAFYLVYKHIISTTFFMVCQQGNQLYTRSTNDKSFVATLLVARPFYCWHLLLCLGLLAPFVSSSFIKSY